MNGLIMGLLYTVIAIAVFLTIFGILDKLGFLEKYGLGLSGPMLMWRTEKGKKLIDRIAEKKKFWENYGNLGLIIVSICMGLILFLVAWSAYLASSIPAEQAPSPQMVVGIPGVNPLIPIWYGIFALAVAIVFHEFSHGILSRVADIKVKSLGLVFLVVPIGAFVEPDEEEMEELPKIKRDRIYAVGPTTNILLAIVFALLFSSVFMASIAPREDGLIVNGISPDSPADIAGLERGDELTYINGVKIDSPDQITDIQLDPGIRTSIRYLEGEEEKSGEIRTGLVVTSVSEGLPAEEAGLEKGDILISIDGELVRNYEMFDSILDTTDADQTVNITYMRQDNGDYDGNVTIPLTLTDKYEVYEENYPSQNKEEYRGKGYMGVSVAYLGFTGWDAEALPQMFSQPFKGAESVGDYFMSSMRYISFPFMRLSPVPDDIASLYEVSGPLSVLPDGVFWVMGNGIYWVFWLNLMVGLFNALPAVPLDGGYVFSDGVSALVEKFGMKKEAEEKLISGISYLVAFIILGLLMWQLIGPRI